MKITNTEAFRRWFGKSLVVDDAGEPLVVYRGEHGRSDSQIHSRSGAISFSGNPESASLYAEDPNNRNDTPHSPRVLAAYLRIENPVIHDLSDPFIDFIRIIEILGREEAVQIAIEFEEFIRHTNNWEMIVDKYGEDRYLTVEELLHNHPEALEELYFDAYPLFDNPKWVQKFKASGYDGVIQGGNGDTALEAEYKVFDLRQIKSATGNRGTFDPNSEDITETGFLLLKKMCGN